ncbi:hypothetical protein, partial [Alteromonas sp. KUL49]|uniref:hypothetical protein n=1 Tax=Alteromonas sp. KUL49 TaxID=2480798 RepID=UPI00102EF532
LQAFMLVQQSSTNKTVQAQMSQLQIQLNKANETNAELLHKVESLESNLELKPRQLLSMN